MAKHVQQGAPAGGDLAGTYPNPTISPTAPVPATVATALSKKAGRFTVTVGKAGSGADFEGDGINDQLAIQKAIDAAANGTAPGSVHIIGYGYLYQYIINGPITLKSCNPGGDMVNIIGNHTVLKLSSTYTGDCFITDNFYNDIYSNYNSYSLVGTGIMRGLTIEGNAGSKVRKTTTYASFSNFPATGVDGKIYVARDTDTGYTWSISSGSYVTTNIKNSGKHWRAYASHLIKLYAYEYILEDIRLNDALEFALYSEQTNTDTVIFNNYSTMEPHLKRVHIVGYQLGGINWFGPHDGHWDDVKVHTNEYATQSLYNIYVAQTANSNGGGLVWYDVHPWGPTASYGSNLVVMNASIRGDAYVEGSPNRGIYAYQSSLSLHLIVTNSPTNIELDQCFDTHIDTDVYYLYNPLQTVYKLTGSLLNSQLLVNTVNTNNVGSGAKIFDVTGLTTTKNVSLFARVPYSTPNAITAGVTSSSLDQSSSIDIVVAGATTATTTTIRRYPVGTKTVSYGTTAIDYGTLALTSVADPSNAQDAATKAYVDTAITTAATSYDDVKEYANLAAFPATGVADTIYLADATGFLYRWSGSTYVQVGGGTSADATTSSKGIVQLAGDLGGTAASPTVPGLATKATDSSVVHLAGTETVTGAKSFSAVVNLSDVTTAAGGIIATSTNSSTDSNSALAARFTNIGNRIIDSRITGETIARYVMYGDGKHEWGPGGSNVRDTNLYRPTNDTLQTDDKFIAGGGLKIGSSSTVGQVWTATDTAGNGSYQTISGIPESAVTNLTTDLAARLQLGGDIGGTTTSPKVKRTSRFIVAPYGDTRPADYTCASATGNEVEINQALTAAAALPNGGVVDLLDGTFTISNVIVPPNNVWLRGAGMFQTKITQVAGATHSLIDNYSAHSVASPWTNAIISDLELDGSNMSATVSSKGINSNCLNNCKFLRIYCHDTTATGLGADDFYGSTISECIVVNCGYVNKKTITAASWSSSTYTFATSASHGYSIGDVIVITGMTPTGYNGRYVVTSVPTSTTFTIDASNNSGSLTIGVNPGVATAFGNSSDSLIGHNGIGIASGANASEANIITNNFCFGNQNNNYLIEADNAFTNSNASYIFSNNVSVSAGQCGFRNTGTPNVQFNNNYDYGSQFGAYITNVTSSKTITAGSWSGGAATLTTSTAHSYTVGQKVIIAGMTPTGYNGYYTVASIPTSTTFTVTLAVDPGTATAFGTSTIVAHGVDGTMLHNNDFSYNPLYGIRVDTRCNGVSVRSNNIHHGTNYGVYIGSGNGAVSQNRIYNNGLEGVYIFTTSTGYMPLNSLDVSSNHVYNNGVAAASHDGISVNSNVNTPITNLSICGNNAFDDQDTKTQRYGVIVRSGGNNSNISITDNNLAGNLTGGLLLQDASDTIYASNNTAVNPVGKSELGTVTGTIIVDSKLANFYTATLGGNISATFPVGVVKGDILTVAITQDATGNRTVTWSGLILWSRGGAPALTTTAGATDVFTFRWNGTNWLEASRSLSRVNGVAEGGTGAITLTGLVKGNGTSAMTAAVSGTDYQAPITLTTTGTSGAATLTSNTLNIPQYSGGGSVTYGSGLIDYNRKQPFIYCDFMSTASTSVDPFLGTTTASGTLASATGSNSHPGQARFASSTTANSGAYIGTNSSAMLIGGGEIFEAVFWPDVFTGTTIRIGFSDSTTQTAPVDGAYIEMAPTTGVVTAMTSSNSSRTSSGTTYTLTTQTWYRIRITVNAGATSIAYALYNDAGTLLWSEAITTTIPTATGRETGAGAVANNSGTTVVGMLNLDYMAVTWSSDRTR